MVRFHIFKIGTLAAALSAVIILGTLIGVNAVTDAGSYYLGRAKKNLAISSVKTEEKKVALTFDIERGAEGLDEMLDALERGGARATFFLSGFWVDGNPEAVKKIDGRGMEIGTHSNTHPHMNALTAEQVRYELETSIKRISDITEKKVELFRPPYHEYNDRVLEEAKRLGLHTVVGERDSGGEKPQEVAERIQKSVKSGSIITMHSDAADAIPLVVEALKLKGFEIVTAGELIYKENYVVDGSGKQIKTK